MIQQQLYNIAIYEGEILLSDYTQDVERTFIIKQEDLVKLFDYGKTFYMKPFPGLIWLRQEDHQKTYCVHLPRQTRKLIYETKTKKIHLTMQLPNLLVIAKEKNNHMKIESLFAFRAPLTSSTTLLSPALPNQMSQTGFCQGGGKIPVNNNPLKAIDDCLFETAWNHHGQIVGKEKLPFLKYHKKYKGRMPLATLTPVRKAEYFLEAK